MNTKLSQIEKSLKLKYRLEQNVGSEPHGGTGGVGGHLLRAPSAGGAGPSGMGGGDVGGFGHPRNRENEQLVEELHRYNSVLLRENSDLKTKVKVKQACSYLVQLTTTFPESDGLWVYLGRRYNMGLRRVVTMHIYDSRTYRPYCLLGTAS